MLQIVFLPQGFGEHKSKILMAWTDFLGWNPYQAYQYTYIILLRVQTQKILNKEFFMFIPFVELTSNLGNAETVEIENKI